MSDLRDKVSRLSIKAEEECDTADCYDAVMDEIISLCQPQWISVEDRLPKFEQQVLITDGKSILKSVFNQGGFEYDFNHETTYWHTLPEIPDE